MPITVDPVDPKRYIQLLRHYLKKSGRKQVELARASNVSESMLSKVLKGKAKPSLDNFRKFQAAFLVAYGGITQARQAREMAALLGDNLDGDDLAAMAKAVEHFKDPELDSVHFRDRAEAFRATIPVALNTTDATKNDPDGSSATSESPMAIAEPAVVDLQAEATPEEGPEPSTVVPENAPADVPAALAAWQAVLHELTPQEPPDTLSPDEVIAAVLDWESRQPDPESAATFWDHLGTPAQIEPFRQRARLDYFLRHLGVETTWNQLEWQWLNHILAETAQRQAGGAQLSPSQLAAFVLDLGRVAFAAVKADTAPGDSVAINLAELAQHLPMAQAISWKWLAHVAQTGLILLSVSPDGRCVFASREEAEFLAAQYLIQAGADKTLLEIAQSGGRPFGVLNQAMRTLHFTGRDEAVEYFVGALLKVSEDLPLKQADAAYLLATAEAPTK